jgi:phosphotransacetylase
MALAEVCRQIFVLDFGRMIYTASLPLDRVLLFSDCAIVPDRSPEQLAAIAGDAARSAGPFLEAAQDS